MNTVTQKLPAQPTELRDLRDRIDDLDRRILDLMAERFGFAKATLTVKLRHGLQTFDTQREAEVVRRAAGLARERGIEPELVREIFWRLIELSRLAQRAPDTTREAS